MVLMLALREPLISAECVSWVNYARNPTLQPHPITFNPPLITSNHLLTHSL
ncbi:hypothetical protein Hanom_Chr04g00378931 [Helianthus anomalus]